MGVATCRKRTIIATRPRLRPPARRPGQALQLAGSERSLRLGPAYDPRPEDQGALQLAGSERTLRLAGQLKPVTPCRKCMIATCGGAVASYTRMYYVCLRIGQRYSHCERTPSQEQRSSARRGQADRDAEGSASFSGNRTPSRAAIVSPPWFSGPGLQVQCDEFPRFELACAVHSTGAYAPRSWSGMRALGELWVFQQQIRPEHRCVRGRAQHTCVFHLQTRYVHHGWRTPSAPGCVCGRCCKCAILADEKDAFPLLVARRSFAAKNDICDAQTHVRKSGGR
jgi:hypothetical protein